MWTPVILPTDVMLTYFALISTALHWYSPCLAVHCNDRTPKQNAKWLMYQATAGTSEFAQLQVQIVGQVWLVYLLTSKCGNPGWRGSWYRSQAGHTNLVEGKKCSFSTAGGLSDIPGTTPVGVNSALISGPPSPFSSNPFCSHIWGSMACASPSTVRVIWVTQLTFGGWHGLNQKLLEVVAMFLMRDIFLCLCFGLLSSIIISRQNY